MSSDAKLVGQQQLTHFLRLQDQIRFFERIHEMTDLNLDVPDGGNKYFLEAEGYFRSLDYGDGRLWDAKLRRGLFLLTQANANADAPALLPSGSSPWLSRHACIQLASWMRITGYGHSGRWRWTVLAAYLNDQGQTNRRGGQWTPQNIRAAVHAHWGGR
jgi:hypothetical protein